MPIDPRIPLQSTPPADPVTRLGEVMGIRRAEQQHRAQLAATQQALGEHQQAQADQAAIQAVLRKSGGQFTDAALAEIATIHPEAALSLQNLIATGQLRQAETGRTLTPPAEPLVQVDEGGRPVYRPRSQAVGQPAYTPPPAPEPLERVDEGGRPVYRPRSQAVGQPAYTPPPAGAAPGSFADYLSAPPDRQAAIVAGRKAYGHAADRADPAASLPPPIAAGTMTLDQIPAADRAWVQGLLDYRLPMPTGYALARSPVWIRRVDLAAAVDPTFDVTQYAARQAARKDFTSGKAAQNLRGLNTAVGHIDSLVKASQALHNTASPDYNAILNQLAQHLPVTAGLQARQGGVTGIRTKFNAVKGELAAIFKQNGATDQEIASWGHTVGEPASASPAQWNAFVDGALELMGSRLGALKNQYAVAMGKPPTFRLLSADSRRILQALGVDVNALEPESSPPATSTTPAAGAPRFEILGVK